MRAWDTDNELFDLMSSDLYTAVVGDIMDQMGLTSQFLPPSIQPLEDTMVVAGRAMPVLVMDDSGGEGPGRRTPTVNQPFGLMLDALDELQTNEVYLAAGSTPVYALWGELMSMAATNRGARGAVVIGYSRDTRGILEQGFPCFSMGRYAQDQRPRGKVIDYRCRISVGAVSISPGDIVFGDLDGVCVIPAADEEEVLSRALEKAHGERQVFEAIKGGMKARESWERFGIM